MKTNSINQKKVMKVKTIALMLCMIPLISYGGNHLNSGLVSDLNDHCIVSEEENLEHWMSDGTTRLSEVSENIDPEEEMEIEKWMIDVSDKIWHNEVVEEEIQIEEWMYNVESLPLGLYSMEEEIEIENWMLNPSSWLESR